MFLSKKKVQEMYEERELLKAQLADQREYAMQMGVLADFRQRRVEDLREQIKAFDKLLDAGAKACESKDTALRKMDQRRQRMILERDRERRKAESLLLLFSKLAELDGGARELCLEKILKELPACPEVEDIAKLLERLA